MKPWIKNLLALAIIAGVALAIFGMVRDGKANASSTTASCSGVQSSIGGLQSQASMAKDSSQPWMADRYTLAIAHMVANDPACFDPALVATAQAALDRTGH